MKIAIISKKNDKIKKNIITSDSKKKSKNSKDIFLSKEITEENKNIKENKDTKENKKENNDESTFKKTEVLTKNKIEELIKSIKKTSTVADIQDIAMKLDILTVSGSTKTGKPKNKTRQELIDEINNKYNNM